MLVFETFYQDWVRNYGNFSFTLRVFPEQFENTIKFSMVVYATVFYSHYIFDDLINEIITLNNPYIGNEYYSKIFESKIVLLEDYDCDIKYIDNLLFCIYQSDDKEITIEEYPKYLIDSVNHTWESINHIKDKLIILDKDIRPSLKFN